MKIQDFRSFLLACQNVCVIKKKQVPINNAKPATIQETLEKAKAEEEKKEEADAPLPVNPRASRARRRREAKAKAEQEAKK